MNLPRPLLVLALLLVHAVLWWVPVARSLRFCTYTAALYGEDGTLNAWGDVQYAHSLRNAYLAAAGVSLAYAAVGLLTHSRLLLALGVFQWLLPLWIMWRRPEEVVVLISSGANLIATACALIFGGYLLHHLMTSESDARSV